MKLLIIRHADPDYDRDSLTQKGWREAQYLAKRLVPVHAAAYYVSPLGRAKDTASLTLKQVGKTATEKEWLREFAPQIWRPDVKEHEMIAWDWLPQDWSVEESYYNKDAWYATDIFENSDVKKEYDWVSQGLDEVLANHGYERNGAIYRVVQGNEDTICFFCHFGVECVLLSHLLNISPMVLWHSMCAAPSSVTTLVSEERRAGTASFRMTSFGDISHLYANAEIPSFQARFCETNGNGDRED